MAETLTHKFDRIRKETLYEMGYQYLCDNFHKFKEENKIRIALTIITIFNKDGSKTSQDMKQIIIMNDVIKNGQQLRYNIGQPSVAGDVEDSGQIRSSNNQA